MFVAKHSEDILKGRVQAEELRGQFGERLPGAYQAAARAMGVTTEELSKMSENGELVAEDLLPVLSTELLKMANEGDQLAAALNNTNSAVNRFSNNVLLANKTFNESGFDKTIRDLMNTMSDAIDKAEPLWRGLGAASEFVIAPLRAAFELFGSVSARLDMFGDAAEGNEQKVKLFGLAVASLFRWSRKLVAAFLLIPAAMSGVAKIIDGEQLTWQEWALTLAGIAASLPIILKALRGIKKMGGAAGAMMPKGTAATTAKPATTVSDDARRAAQRVAGASDWQQAGRRTIFSRIAESAKEAARKGARGGAGFLPIGAGSTISEEEFVRRQEEIPWWDLIGRLEQKQQQMNQQPAITGDITFNINGENSKQIADEVLNTIQDMYRSTATNEPVTEK